MSLERGGIGAIFKMCLDLERRQGSSSLVRVGGSFLALGKSTKMDARYSPLGPNRDCSSRQNQRAGAANKVAVVKSVINSSIARTEVKPLPSNLHGVHGEINDEVSFVLAFPIFKTDGSIWGTIDFDAGNETGKRLLETEVSDATMFQLSQHLKVILSLPEELKAENA